jgi:peptidoglycan hydrolase CwlO-like protein
MSFSILVILITLIVSVVCSTFLVILFKRCNSQLETIKLQDDLLSELRKKTNNLSEEIHEIRSGNHGVITRVKELVKQVDTLQLVQQNSVEQDSQSRFYSKGAKLISQGASLDDVMRECDMPVAEAELLFNLHNKKR